MQSWIPSGAEIELKGQPNWVDSSLPLVVEYDVKIPGWVSGAGHRAIMPLGFFGAEEKHVFEHSHRVHPIYMEYPTVQRDDATLELPLDWKVKSIPPAKKDEGHIVGFSLAAEEHNGTIHITRLVSVNFLMLEAKYYSALRNFYQEIKVADEQQIVLQPNASSAKN